MKLLGNRICIVLVLIDIALLSSKVGMHEVFEISYFFKPCCETLEYFQLIELKF